jgi:hypothetical protein
MEGGINSLGLKGQKSMAQKYGSNEGQNEYKT